MSKSKMSVGFVVFVLVLGINLVTVQPATMKPSPAVMNWTCDGTIALTGSSYSYSLPPWSKSGPIGTDRENKCKQDIQNNWLNNGAIWQKLGIPAAQQNAYCQSGGTFRIDYGFDTRKKDWSFTQFGKPSCKCAGPLSFQ